MKYVVMTTVSSVRDFGVRNNSDVTLATHVTATVRTCFAVLRQLSDVPRPLTRDALVTRIGLPYVHFVIHKADSCKSVLAESPESSSLDFSPFSTLLLVSSLWRGNLTVPLHF